MFVIVMLILLDLESSQKYSAKAPLFFSTNAKIRLPLMMQQKCFW